ncbi:MULTISPECIES: Asp-tRNA(Asn)/Glu-tRNA(Gln) amidotransferase subunit GatC [Croceimicrobium]|uniref:Aspartyl/glutamyl-tRNA(Asn/Gln) amidotransferase subunit C n=1 Tax=Croceimicrobium hydrocarbonivorans TaxID=2761580 RepID=A0A7H0VJ13_9FLAO|nr:Asp-tRNA(Asn)/Glu-tRNA(Gln) amidotransferase subunit GatC [Croceimicrobium hydrocarbonivorans]QNR25711.1 Asp-tRNA(Asn)/Glu-tRNA(Gln) amidotransferase subunit GatC [Croceimicrobium hydrocarbonivorans]
MKISLDEIRHLAHLARLEFSEEEMQSMQGDMDKILGFVEKINELDLEGVEPLVYLSEERNVLREDVSETVLTKDEALKNAPDKDSDYFRVPKVLKREED